MESLEDGVLHSINLSRPFRLKQRPKAPNLPPETLNPKHLSLGLSVQVLAETLVQSSGYAVPPPNPYIPMLGLPGNSSNLLRR